MAEDLKQRYPGCEVEFVKGGGGIYDIRLNDKLIYSKHQTGRFPDNSEVFEKTDLM